MVGNDGVAENIQPVALLRFEQPLKPPHPVPYKFQKELLLMATEGNMPRLVLEYDDGWFVP